MKRYLIYILLALSAVTACQKEYPDMLYRPAYSFDEDGDAGRVSVHETRNVLLLYSAGFNNINRYLKEDIQDLWDGWLPGEGRKDDILLIYSHTVREGYSTPNPPVLYRLYRDVDNKIVSDTLAVYDENTHSATAGQLNTVLTFVNENFPARSYGMIFSSHATGYLPAGYYTSPSDSSYDWGLFYRFGQRDSSPKPVPYVEILRDPDMPAVKSIGQDLVMIDGSRVSYEMELADFAAAIPMHMSYILFDACLMGGVEVAYELKDKCDVVGFSPTEVLAEGYNYRTLTLNLLDEEPDLKGVCVDYYKQYLEKTGDNQSATISLVDCTRLEGLAELCGKLFDKYREGLRIVSPSEVQRYYTFSYHWFYDLESIITEAGKAGDYAQDELDADLEALRAQLDEVIIYKAATPAFLPGYGGFRIDTYSGLSMYLPCDGGPNLDSYYRTLAWNIRTGLVE